MRKNKHRRLRKRLRISGNSLRLLVNVSSIVRLIRDGKTSDRKGSKTKNQPWARESKIVWVKSSGFRVQESRLCYGGVYGIRYPRRVFESGRTLKTNTSGGEKSLEESVKRSLLEKSYISWGMLYRGWVSSTQPNENNENSWHQTPASEYRIESVLEVPFS